MQPGLYAIVDVDSLQRASRPPLDFARRVLDAGRLSALQLRAKSMGARDLLGLATALRPLCVEAKVPFFLNDRPDVAWLAGTDGVHLGLDDLPIELARRVAPGLQVGVSTHTPSEFAAALTTDADYVAVGPVFATATKPDAAPVVGLATLRSLCAASGDRPVVAIGGITLANAREIHAAGARAGAVIGALLVDDGAVTSVARSLHLRLSQG
jgi:thiamine-phosphate pyrophosphorylase